MKKIAYLLSVYLFCLLPKLQAQDIDFPLSLSEIEKYESRIRIQRLPAVTITHADAYKIRTRQPVYSPRTKEIVLDIINMDGPTAELEYHNLKQMVNGKWLGFPFIDNLVFAIGGRDLSKGDTLPEHIRMSEFKYPLKPNRYQANFYVFANIHTYCNLTGKSIVSIKETEMDGAFAFKVLPSNNDSIRILFENHTNLEVQPVFFPSISTDERYMVHPFARSGWIGEANYMKSRARLKGGEAILFTIPVSWDVNRITDRNDTKDGRYIEVTGTSEIEIVPDRIHYIIEIREYFEEEFDGRSKPEEYRTKISLDRIEQGLREVLHDAGISPNAVRTQEIGDYWRKQGQDFLVAKTFDITLLDFKQIDEILKRMDTKGIHTMRIGELENKDMLSYHQKGKIAALKAAQRKASYLVEALGKKLGPVIRIVEDEAGSSLPFSQSNVLSSSVVSFDSFRTIKKKYSMLVRFEIAD